MHRPRENWLQWPVAWPALVDLHEHTTCRSQMAWNGMISLLSMPRAKALVQEPMPLHQVGGTTSTSRIIILCCHHLPALQADMPWVVSHKDKLELVQSLDNRFTRFLVESREALLRAMMVSAAAVAEIACEKGVGDSMGTRQAVLVQKACSCMYPIQHISKLCLCQRALARYASASHAKDITRSHSCSCAQPP